MSQTNRPKFVAKLRFRKILIQLAMEQVLFSLIKLQFNSTFTVLGYCQICFWYANLSIKVTQLRFLSLFLALAISLLMRHQVLYIGIGSLTSSISLPQNKLRWQRATWMVFRALTLLCTQSGFADGVRGSHFPMMTGCFHNHSFISYLLVSSD